VQFLVEATEGDAVGDVVVVVVGAVNRCCSE
jgi:hypothetical protein